MLNAARCRCVIGWRTRRSVLVAKSAKRRQNTGSGYSFQFGCNSKQNEDWSVNREQDSELALNLPIGKTQEIFYVKPSSGCYLG